MVSIQNYFDASKLVQANREMYIQIKFEDKDVIDTFMYDI